MSSTDRVPTGHLVWLLAMRWRSAIDAELHDAGLSHATYVLLSSLKALTSTGSPVTQKELSAYTGLEPMYVSRLVRQLEESDLVVRRVDEHDGRAQRVALTPTAKRLLDKCIPRVHALMGDMTAPLVDDGREELLRACLHDLLDVAGSRHAQRNRQKQEKP
jgi:MarR family transcriptional regulator, organic hydroperoxide resistance regulator